ncbi:MAG TPA: hypothetical protein VN650_01280, partial [Gemmatimonadaceae bacterium]|nr:hypothetical protein [Gemmatimonadaceae bacterium]
MIPVVCGPLSVLPHSADAWTPGPRPSAIKRKLRNAKPVSYPVMLLACGVLIANVAPRVPVRPLPMSPVIVFAPTMLQRGLE